MSGHWLNPVGRPERVALPGDRPGSRSYRARMAGIDVVIAELGERQAGTMSRQQLLDSGIGAKMVHRSVERGRLIRLHRGVYRVPGAPVTRLQGLWAAHLFAGPGSVASHGSAGYLWRLEAVEPCPPTVTVPHERTVRTPAGVIIHRSRHLDPVDQASQSGLMVTNPARTIVDLAGQYRRARLGAVLEGAHFNRHASYTQVGEALLRTGGSRRPGSGLLCNLLDEHTGGENLAQSVLEQLLGELLRRAGIEHFVRQHPLPSLGAIEGMVDAYVDYAAMITEVDGRRWHARQAAMKRDRDRDFAAAQVGVITVRFLHEHLTSDMDACAEGLRRVVATRLTEAQRLLLP